MTFYEYPGSLMCPLCGSHVHVERAKNDAPSQMVVRCLAAHCENHGKRFLMTLRGHDLAEQIDA